MLVSLFREISSEGSRYKRGKESLSEALDKKGKKKNSVKEREEKKSRTKEQKSFPSSKDIRAEFGN